jgi:Cu(I)/Ag(I) efflux system membrane fusion protein
MDLELLPASRGADATAHASDVPGLEPVHLSPERIQMIGVRTAVVVRRPFGAKVDLVGFVAPDESRVRSIQVRAAGWVQQLHVSRTGEVVRAGAPLLTIYSPELFQSEQEFLIELGATDSLRVMTHEAGVLASARERLRLLGIPDEEVRRLERERTASTRITLRSPLSGTLFERSVSEGQYVSAGSPLFTIVDLSHLWVLADLYEHDLENVRLGDRARFTADALPGRMFDAAVQFIEPTVSTDTRTIKARLALANPGGALKPGMYGRVHVQGRTRSSLVVPGEAVVRTGENSYVFLAHAGGGFEPRRVDVGREAGDEVEIVRGVAAGDTVVSSASFLIDSESRLKAAIAGMGGPAAKPAAGHAH